MPRGRPRIIQDAVRVEVWIPRGHLQALDKIFPLGRARGIRQAIAHFLEQSLEWLDHEIQLRDQRHAEDRARLLTLRDLAKKQHLEFNEEQIRLLHQRATQVSILGWDENRHRYWAEGKGFTERQIQASAALLQELMQP